MLYASSRLRSFARITLALATAIACLLLIMGEAHRELAAVYAERDQNSAQRVLDLTRSSHWQVITGVERDAIEWQLQQNPKRAQGMLAEALAHRPIDPYLWSRMSVAAFYAGDIPAGELATRLALELAPHTYPIAIEQAALGSQFLQKVSSDTQNIWQTTAIHAINSRPRSTKRYLTQNRLETAFCNLLPKRHPQQRWCSEVALNRARCKTAKGRSKRLRKLCLRNGFELQ